MALLLSAQALSHGLQASRAALHGRPGRSRLTVSAASSQPPLRSFPAPSSPSSNGSVPPASGSAASSSSSSSSAAAASAVAAPAVKSWRVSPWAAMAWGGAVPERANGRLAMLAFVHIARQEMLTGQTVLQQAAALPSNYTAWPLLALMGLVVYATFPPALAGAKEEDFGFMSVRAEKTNMRAAMLGLAVLTALEWHSGYCFF